VQRDLADYDALIDDWGVVPALATRIPEHLAAARGSATG
jgi:hypothetical protein